MAPTVENNALTIIFRFSNLLITLKGLSALRALNAFNAANYEPLPMSIRMRSSVEMHTTKASTLFHPESRYGLTSPRLFCNRPRAITLIDISTIKHRVNPIFK